MSHVLSLVCAPAAPVLTDALLEEARAALAARGLTVRPARWLAPGIATEIAIDDLDAEQARALATALAQEGGPWQSQPVDANLVVGSDRRKRLLVADMDSTMITVECIDEIAAELGLKEQVAAITEAAMRGAVAFEDALRERVALLAGLDTAMLQSVYDNRVRFTPGGRALVATMAAHGARTALVSGGFTFFTERVAEALGFDANWANRLETDADGRLTGRVIEPILGRDAKRAALESEARAAGIATTQALAVGDGANDLAMIDVAGLGAAFHAKPAVAAQADVDIRHGDLTALLYLQGYSQDQIHHT